MAQPIAIRRASIYGQRVRQLAEAATREPREIERRHLLGLAAMYQRIADDLASEKSDEIQSATFQQDGGTAMPAEMPMRMPGK